MADPIIDNLLDKVQSTREDLVKGLDRLFAPFQTATNDLVKELQKKVQDLERKDEVHKQKVREFESKIDDLLTENRVLKLDKVEFEKTKRINQENVHSLDKLSRQIDLLKEENKRLRDQQTDVDQENMSLQQKLNDQAKQFAYENNHLRELVEQCKKNEKIALSEQANYHEEQMVKTKESMEAMIRRLERDIRDRNSTILKLQTEIARREELYKSHNSKMVASVMKSMSTNPIPNNNPPVTAYRTPSKTRVLPNPATAFKKALGGSSISSSTTSSSSLNSRTSRRHNDDQLFGVNSKRARY